MFPAVILALIVPSLRDARTPDARTPDAKTLRCAAAGGAVIALAATPFAPAGLPILLALPAALLLLRERAAPADPP